MNEDQSQEDANLTSLGATFTDLPHSVRFTALQKGQTNRGWKSNMGWKKLQIRFTLFWGVKVPQGLRVKTVAPATTSDY